MDQSMKPSRHNKKTLSSDEEKILAARIQAGRDDATGTLTPDATDARDELVMKNVGLVYSQTNDWREIAPWLVEDLEQVGLAKLIELASTFDEARGTRFSTHAYAQIRWELGYFADAQKSLIRVPAREAKKLRKNKRVGTREAHRTSLVSLDALTPGIAMYPLNGPPEEDTAAAERVDSIMETSGLTSRQKQVIGLVYGLTVNPRYTQQEAADLLGVTRVAVTQIVARALAKMKNSQMVMAA